MTEVDKNVDVLPVIYTVTVGGWMTLNKPKMVGKFCPVKIVKSHNNNNNNKCFICMTKLQVLQSSQSVRITMVL